jgi:diguanylate cyclase (GGDEF)-like protein/PAS domain S-box-containing protein
VSAEHEQQRLAALKRYDTLDPGPREALDRLAKLVAQCLGAPFGFVSIVGESSVSLVGTYGIPHSSLPLNETFCVETIQGNGVLFVSDASVDTRFSTKSYVAGGPFIRFYAGASVVTADGLCIGTIAVLSPTPRKLLEEQHELLLKSLASAVLAELEVRKVSSEKAKVAMDLEFWNRVSSSMIGASDFNKTLDLALAYCAERTRAAVCFVVVFFPEYGLIDYLKSYVVPGSPIASLGVENWFTQYRVEDLSFGSALLEGEIADTGDLIEGDSVARYPGLMRMLDGGIKRQLTYPFRLDNLQFALVLGFQDPAIDEDLGSLVAEFINRITPLLLGRLRDDALERANRALRTLNATSTAFAKAEKETDLYHDLCKIAVEVGGYNTCVIGIAEHDDAKTVKVVACAGKALSYVQNLRLSWSEEPNGLGPAGRAIRERRIVRANDIAHNPMFALWRSAAMSEQLNSVIAIPFGPGSNPAVGVFGLYSSNPMAFGSEEQGILTQLTDHLQKSREALFTRIERDRAVQSRFLKDQQIDRLLRANGVVLYAMRLKDERIDRIHVSHNIEEVLGYGLSEIGDGDWWLSNIHPADREAFLGAISNIKKVQQSSLRYRVRHGAGEYRWIRDEMSVQREADGAARLVGVWVDITEHYLAEDKIYHLAHIDPLTELPNRRLLNERIQSTLNATRKTGTFAALLFMDLDRFKMINDMGGHSAGDMALKEVAHRLRRLIRGGDTVARIGGDEFVILLAGYLPSAEEAVAGARRVGEKIIESLKHRPITVGHESYHIGASVGFSIFPKADDTLDSLYREADTAMYQAKAGDQKIMMFATEMHELIRAKHAMEDEIRRGLETGRFQLWLQDQVDGNGMIMGAEVLPRLAGGDGQILAPAHFIGVAEGSDLIVPLGRWVLREACSLLARIQPSRPEFRLSVNVSPRQFRDPDFVDDVISAIRASGARADRLTIEITETLLISNVDEIQSIMRMLADIGVAFSIDDFGTGYSNLRYLQQLPIHEVKIDRGFVNRLPDDAASVAIVEAIIALAHRLGLSVVAEGVETPSHVQFMSSRGCQKMQGYFFNRPTPSEDWLKARGIRPRNYVHPRAVSVVKKVG